METVGGEVTRTVPIRAQNNRSKLPLSKPSSANAHQAMILLPHVVLNAVGFPLHQIGDNQPMNGHAKPVDGLDHHATTYIPNAPYIAKTSGLATEKCKVILGGDTRSVTLESSKRWSSKT